MTEPRDDAMQAVNDILDRLGTHLDHVRLLVADPDAATIRQVLPVVGQTINTLKDLEEFCFAWRLDLWRAGRRLTPPITNPELGQMAGVSEVAVMKVMRKDRDTREAAEAAG